MVILGPVNWYDRAELYDIAFSWDPGPERDFIFGASERWGIPRPARIFEPMCGSGRLLRTLRVPFAVGLDLNARMAHYASATGRIVRGDAAFCPFAPESFDLAYNLIDSFRHLISEEQAANHLAAVGRLLRPGGVYLLGFDLFGDSAADVYRDQGDFCRGATRVSWAVRTLGDADPVSRLETMHVVLDVTRNGEEERIESFQPLRTYSRRQFLELLDRAGTFEIAATCDRDYRVDRTVPFGEAQGSTVCVLRKRRGRGVGEAPVQRAR